MDIGAWLRDLGLERYEEAFREHEIDLGLLPTLTAEDLKDLGVSVVGHRRKLLNAIAALREAEPGPEHEANLKPEAVLPPAPAARDGSEAERRQLTVLFCDIVASTELAARLDPEDMGALMREFQDCCTEVIKRWEGYIAKFTGDGAAVYFGYPKAYEDGAERAVRAGLELTEAVGRLSTPVAEHLRVRVGIATGLVVVGDLIGEEAAQERPIAGETPHLAARLQALAQPGAVVVAPNTRRLLGSRFELADLGPHNLKGFAKPIRAWQVLGESQIEGRFEAMHQADLAPLIGREEELQLLLSRWRRAKEGDGQVVLLSGEAGIGKSRIAQALGERIAQEPCKRLRYYCSPYHINSALHPVIEQLERAAGFQRTDPPEIKLDKLEATLSRGDQPVVEAAALLAPLLSIATGARYPPMQLSPKQQKERTFNVLLDQLRSLASRRPVLILFEDAHWIDPSTGELLHLLVAQMQRLPILLVVTFRPEFVPPWSGYSHITQLSLSRLSQRHASVLVEGLTAGRSLPREVLAQILIRTDGVPLFLEELTKTVLESGLLEGAGESLALCGPWSPLAIPTTLQDSLLARLDRLAPVKEVAQTGAVIGREFSRDLLSAVAQIPEPALDHALDQLVASELVFRQGGEGPDATFTFKHALVRDAAYQSLLRSRRRQLHSRVAHVLETEFPDLANAAPELVAWHYTGADLKEPAVVYWQRAGQHAIERSAHVEAIAHLTNGLELLGTLPRTPERTRQELALQIALGPALMAAKGQGAPEVGHAYARARELCQEVGEPVQLFPVLWGLWRFRSIRAEHQAARQLAEECLGLAERLRDSALLAPAYSALGGTLLWLGEVAAAQTCLERAAASYDPDRHRALPFRFGQDPAVSSLSYSAWSLWGLGYPDQALRRSDEARTLAEQLASPVSVAASLVYAAMTHQFRREGQAAQERAEAAIALSDEHGLPQFATVGTILRGWALAAQGAADEGIAEMRQGLAVRREQGIELARPWYLALLAGAYDEAGQIDEGMSVLAEALSLPDAGFFEPELRRLEGVLLLKRSGRAAAAEAQACFEQGLDLARRQGTKGWELRAAISLAGLWRRRGRPQDARDLLAPIFGWFTEGFDTADLKDARALLAQLR
ncbi:MAG: AAA family ATPase [Geminicoccaceae bacterium]